ncbi:aldo/keto reductase [Colletotrichum scovillei]|uniref:Aldo/keto reductase n=2 Tax=Colletotrichum scovillei TaxID=1209932 RepID=A0A9P7UJG2_9PEZI|nr:aldo/keto reductase [Colletotrichum scovillei]KAG7077987.1 aldo/keto reductase [Colletotrichum scovillei]KAG7085056.1 aldo/keto reductase [Colletotrichum scovillei]
MRLITLTACLTLLSSRVFARKYPSLLSAASVGLVSLSAGAGKATITWYLTCSNPFLWPMRIAQIQTLDQTKLMKLLESCNNGRGFCKGGRCEPNNDPSGAGPFVGNFKECQTGNGRSQVDDFILGGGDQDAQVNAGAACNNGRGTCSARGACEPNNDPSGAGPFVGTFEECFNHLSALQDLPQFFSQSIVCQPVSADHIHPYNDLFIKNSAQLVVMSSKELPARLRESIESTKVEYRQLGKSGLRVSVPIFGCMSFGDSQSIDWALNEDEALPLLKAAYDRGLNTWDTANAYSNGASERTIAKALKKYNIPREKVVILTKCFFAVGEEPETRHFNYREEINKSKDYQNQWGLSRASIFNQVEASLKRLDTPYIDLLQIHRFDPRTPVEETMKALHDLVQTGKVRYIGASSMWGTQFAQMQFIAEKNGWTKFVSMQNHYNLLYREEEREMNRFCNDTGVGLIPWAPLCRGHLARPPKDFGSTSRSKTEKEGQPGSHGTVEPDLTIIKRVQEIAEKRDWPMSHVALAWINKRITSPIIGFSSVERIDQAITADGKVLTDEEEKYLEELYQPKAISGHA